MNSDVLVPAYKIYVLRVSLQVAVDLYCVCIYNVQLCGRLRAHGVGQTIVHDQRHIDVALNTPQT
jgi:hypothetical protein